MSSVDRAVTVAQRRRGASGVAGDDLGTDCDRGLLGSTSAEIESDRRHDPFELGVGDPRFAQPFDPPGKRAAAPHGTEIADVGCERRLRRVPVHGETPDDIEGVLDVHSLLRDPGVHYSERLDVPSFVPETMKVLALLKSFLSHPQGMAFVVDEHGGVEGIVTLRDLVEEIIGDAVPQTDAKFYIEEIGDGRVLASGAARLEDITEALDVPFDEEGIDTIGGLIFTQLGQLPKKGQVLNIGRLRVTVRRVSRKRVDEVLLVREADAAEEEGA